MGGVPPCVKVCQEAPCCSLSLSPTIPCTSQVGHHHKAVSKEVTVRDSGLYGGKQANSSNLLTRFLIKSPLLGLFTDSSGPSHGGFDPVFLQAFLLSAVLSFLHDCRSWTLAFHFIFIWLLPQLPIFKHFAYYQSGPSCTLLSFILLIGSSVGPAFPKRK